MLLEFTDFQDFPGPPTIFKDFPVLENARLKFKYVPGFPRPVLTLSASILHYYNQCINLIPSCALFVLSENFVRIVLRVYKIYPIMTNLTIDPYHSAAMLSLGGIKSFVFARQASATREFSAWLTVQKQSFLFSRDSTWPPRDKGLY